MPPTLEELASILARDYVPVVVSNCDAEGGRGQLTVFRQLEETAIRARFSKKVVDLCGFNHFCNIIFIE